MLRFDFSRSGIYLPVPRGFKQIDLDDVKETLYTSPSAETLYTPPDPVLYFSATAPYQTVDIATTGVVTFNAGEPPEDLLTTDNFVVVVAANGDETKYAIASVSNAGVVTVTRSEAAPAALTGLHYRVEGPDNTAAVDASGSVTFAGDAQPPAADLAVGHVIQIGDTVTTIDSADPLTVAPAAAVTAGAYIVREPDNTAAISAAGVVTFAGVAPPTDDIAVGNILVVGDTEYPITAVSDEGEATVTTSAAVAAAAYSIVKKADYYDEMGFTVTAKGASGDVDITTVFGNNETVELDEDDWIQDCGKEVICNRIKQSSVVREFQIGLY